MSMERTDIHALVAGVSLYVPGPLRGQVYPPLPGCIVDAREMVSYLVEDLGVPKDQIRLLTCSGEGPEPEEPEEQRPTYANLVAGLQELTAKTRPGDQVLIYFAGHGTRVPTLIPEAKGNGELDECLVPSDAGNGARLLRDVEIAAAVARMADRGLDVTLLLDCCHAGGALKAPTEEITIRGVPFVDAAPRPVTSEIASREELAASWRKTGGRPPAAAVLLAACRPGERALEVLLDGRKRGLFTWALLDALRRLGTGMGYRRLHERVLARVHTLFEIQTPFLDGNGERTVLGSQPRRPLSTVNVLAVERGQESLLLAAGAPHGVGPGSRFAIYPLGTEDPSRAEDRVALVQVTKVGASNSRAVVSKVLRPEIPLEAGAPAVLLSVGLARSRAARLGTDPSSLLDDVFRELARPESSGFIEPSPPGDLPDFRLATGPGGAVEILDSAGEALAGLASPPGPETVIAALEHLARYRSLQKLSNPDEASDLARALQVSLDRLARPWKPGEPFALVPLPEESRSVRAGDWLCLTIENRTRLELNVVVLDLQADWSISQAYPVGAFLPLRGGRSEHIPFQVTWPFRQSRGREHLKVFAALGPVDLLWLQLPALGQPLPQGSPYKALVPENHPQHAWTVVDVVYEVTR